MPEYAIHSMIANVFSSLYGLMLRHDREHEKITLMEIDLVAQKLRI